MPDLTTHPFFLSFVAGASGALAVQVIKIPILILQMRNNRKEIDALKADYNSALSNERERHAEELKAALGEPSGQGIRHFIEPMAKSAIQKEMRPGGRLNPIREHRP